MHGVSFDLKILQTAYSETAIGGVALKTYCAAKQCVAGIEAFRTLLVQDIDPDNIASVHVSVPSAFAAMVSRPGIPETRISRIIGMAYNLALAAYWPDTMRDVSRPDRTGDPKILAFLKKVWVRGDDELSKYYPEQWPAQVEVVMEDGRSFSNRVLDSAGDPSRALSVAEVRDKFMQLVIPILGQLQAVKLAGSCLAATGDDRALTEVCGWLNGC
jgi:2-methylcitrate dehydratase PrpD